MTQTILLAVGLWVGAYLVGATPVSYLLGRFLGGVDLRRRGSGNVGGSNLASQLGRRWLPLVVMVDLSRGAGPILVGQYFLGLGDHTWLLIVAPVFTLSGNAWSPFLKFSGGRSVGVWSGGLVSVSPSLFLAALVTYLCGWFVSRRSAESLLVVMCVLPLACLMWPQSWLLIGSSAQFASYAAIGAMLILTKRLMSNGGPLPADVSRRSVLLNRLFRDRDIADRRQWLARTLDRTNDL